jgi:glucarate dehydratase
MGSASELGIATLAQAYTVASSPGFRGATDTHVHLQEDDVLDPPLALTGGRIRLPAAPGMGVVVSQQKLARLPVPDRIHGYSLNDE